MTNDGSQNNSNSGQPNSNTEHSTLVKDFLEVLTLFGAIGGIVSFFYNFISVFLFQIQVLYCIGIGVVLLLFQFKKINFLNTVYTSHSIRFIVRVLLLASLVGTITAIFNRKKDEKTFINCPIFEKTKKKKVLFIPFLVSDSKEVKGDKIYQEFLSSIHKEGLDSNIDLKYCDSLILNKQQLYNENCIEDIMMKTGCDILIYGEYENGESQNESKDSIICCWHSSKNIRDELDSVAIGTFPSRIHFKNSFEDISSGKIKGCPYLIITFLSLELEFLKHDYAYVVKQFPKVVSNSYCQSCEVSKLAYFMAAQSALRIWDDRVTLKIINSMDTLMERGCHYTKEDSAEIYQINAWLYMLNDQYQLGFENVENTILLFERGYLKNKAQYLNAILLKAYRLNKLHRLREAINISVALIQQLKQYPEQEIINYTNLGGYYGRLFIKNGNYYDSSLYYLKRAEASDISNFDKETLGSLYRNFIYIYANKISYKLSKGNEYIRDSMNLVKYRDLFGMLNVSNLQNENKMKSNYDFDVMQSAAEQYINTAADYKLQDSVKFIDSIRFYTSNAMSLYSVIIDSLTLRKPLSSTLALTYYDIGAYYKIFNKLDSSIFYNKKSAIIYEAIEVSDMLPTVYAFISHNYLELNRIDSSFKYYNLGVDFCRKFPEEADIQNINLEKFNIIKERIDSLIRLRTYYFRMPPPPSKKSSQYPYKQNLIGLNTIMYQNGW